MFGCQGRAKPAGSRLARRLELGVRSPTRPSALGFRLSGPERRAHFCWPGPTVAKSGGTSNRLGRGSARTIFVSRYVVSPKRGSD